MVMYRYRKIVIMIGMEHSMMIEIAVAGDFTANANCTDITTKIPIARMACDIAKISTPSRCSEL
jgi:hypothetical protein